MRQSRTRSRPRQGRTVIQAVLAGWDELPEQARQWLFAWSVKGREPFATDAIRRPLVSESEELLAMALESAAGLDLHDATVNGVAMRHVKHSEARMRRLATEFALQGCNWLNSVSSADTLSVGFREAEKFYFALLNQSFTGPATSSIGAFGSTRSW